VRAQLDAVIEEKLVAANVGELLPAIDAGLLTLAPVEEQDDFFQAYIDALWSVLSDPRYYPLLDKGIADLVHAAVREGAFDPPTIGRSRGRQVGAAHEFIARLPTFPAAGMDEIIDVREELRRPLTVFRSEMVKVARDMKADAFDPELLAEAEEAGWSASLRRSTSSTSSSRRSGFAASSGRRSRLAGWWAPPAGS
jgi:hypothetical protein